MPSSTLPEGTTRVWPGHPQPLADEGFPSWLTRVAQANGLNLHPFRVRVWPQEPALLKHDVSYSLPSDFAQFLAEATTTPLRRVRECLLQSYVGRLWPERPVPRMPWIVLRQGWPFCSACLQEDEQPYFRKSWLLGWTTVCPKHRTFLQNQCPGCRMPLDLLFCSRKQRSQTELVPITECRRCGENLRTTKKKLRATETPLPDALALQESLSTILEEGWTSIPSHGPIYSHLYFIVVRQLTKILLGGATRVERLRQAVQSESRIRLPKIPHQNQFSGVSFEFLDIEARHRLLANTKWLVTDWPDRFLRLCRDHRITTTALVDSMAEVPYWYWNVLRENLCCTIARWRNRNFADSRQQQHSYRSLGKRRLESKRLPLERARVQFVAGHPELWNDSLALATALIKKNLYSRTTDPAQVVHQCERLTALAQIGDDWWQHTGYFLRSKGTSLRKKRRSRVKTE